ncbi:hypothetical protein DL766_001603 [Monosporascus sp. MC13-8B]|uniref:DNase1 protein n=1 Tax=Monosporascus cannonballus TaxID=155416 RepID=A0ABY0HIU8_9PEZI|nr:hypothetical protein DL763_006604 [Monosporascus cannonballus]RYO94465.1 hypothetical protein DL762_000561 [Monosporascus cannonballus]RYP37293.1 hypothetical protein DL766_001603 [Monosporascus sp. MC13-8B]
MHFAPTLAAVAFCAATLVSANSMTFVSLDDTKRTVYVTPDAGHAHIDPVELGGHCEVKIEFPQGWIGNAYTVSEGKENVPGMLAEAAFQGWGGLTYYDVSAIVDPNDHDGVKEMYPASQAGAEVKSSFSGCKVFPCPTAYYLPDDIQTVSTDETDLIVTVGNYGDQERREEDAKYHSRNFVLGKL